MFPERVTDVYDQRKEFLCKGSMSQRYTKVLEKKMSGGSGHLKYHNLRKPSKTLSDIIYYDDSYFMNS